MITDKKRLTEVAVWIRTSEGKEACEYYADYPRLKYATPAQRSHYESDEYGIHWPDIDEDLSYEDSSSPRSGQNYTAYLYHIQNSTHLLLHAGLDYPRASLPSTSADSKNLRRGAWMKYMQLYAR